MKTKNSNRCPKRLKHNKKRHLRMKSKTHHGLNKLRLSKRNMLRSNKNSDQILRKSAEVRSVKIRIVALLALRSLNN